MFLLVTHATENEPAALACEILGGTRPASLDQHGVEA